MTPEGGDMTPENHSRVKKDVSVDGSSGRGLTAWPNSGLMKPFGTTFFFFITKKIGSGGKLQCQSIPRQELAPGMCRRRRVDIVGEGRGPGEGGNLEKFPPSPVDS